MLQSVGGGSPHPPNLMPPTSWVELALAGLAEARGHDGREHRESLLSQLRRILLHLFAKLFQNQTFHQKYAFMTNRKSACGVRTSPEINRNECQTKIIYKDGQKMPAAYALASKTRKY